MKLVEFRVQNFRSVNDSGPIEVRDRTVLVGRNESGKTNLLLALSQLNPASGRRALSETKDFPRERKLSDFKDSLRVVTTKWKLSPPETAELGKVYPRAAKVEEVRVGRYYSVTPWVELIGAPTLGVDGKRVAKILAKLTGNANADLKAFVEGLKDTANSDAWSKAVAVGVPGLRGKLQAAGINVQQDANLSGALDELQSEAKTIEGDEQGHAAARNWVVAKMPTLIYVDDYPSLPGRMDIPALVHRRQQNQLDRNDQYFLKLLKVAGLELDQLHKLLNDAEKRHLLANRAGAVVTKKLRELWKDRELKVRFNLDGNHFLTLISDPNAFYDVEVNLDERSWGLRWFFAFYISFAADTDGGPAENAVLLLDEPGIHLHAVAQRDLLDHFAKDFRNQIVFTTHSPFMIPVDDIPAVRTVNIDPNLGTTVTNSPTGDSRTLFPLQAALGYDLAQTLFVGEKNLVVEGVTDYWYLSAISDHLIGKGTHGLPPGLIPTPSGGVGKVAYMVALLASQRLRVLVLLDSEQHARLVKDELVKEKLAREGAIVTIDEALPTGGDADIEDLLDPKVFDALVAEAYKTELNGKKLQLNPKIPRIVTRYDDAFKKLGIEFHKTRPASLFMRRLAQAPDEVMTQQTTERFSKLFEVITKKLGALLKATEEPFR